MIEQIENLETEAIIDCNLILKLLPHRYPFLLIDKALIIKSGEHGIGIKNFTINEHLFQGHFPGNPIVPGVIIIEALAQTIAVVYNSINLNIIKENADADMGENVGYLISVNIKFLNIVSPGDQLLMEVKLERKISNMSMFTVNAYVKNKVIAKGSINVTQK